MRSISILNSRFVSSSGAEIINMMKSWKARVLSSAKQQEAIGDL
jgi:hypothetical protein